MTDRERLLLSSKQYTALLNEQKRIDTDIDQQVGAPGPFLPQIEFPLAHESCAYKSVVPALLFLSLSN